MINAIWVYNLTVTTGHFDVLRRSFEKVSPDQRIQAIIIAFCFGALLEALAGPIPEGGEDAAAVLEGVEYEAERPAFIDPGGPCERHPAGDAAPAGSAAQRARTPRTAAWKNAAGEI